MSTIPGLHVLGEANFSDHSANRLGASALMQGLADGYFIIPYTLGDYIADAELQKITTEHDVFKEAEAAVKTRIGNLLSIKGSKTVKEFHREIGRILWIMLVCHVMKTALSTASGRFPGFGANFGKTSGCRAVTIC